MKSIQVVMFLLCFAQISFAGGCKKLINAIYENNLEKVTQLLEKVDPDCVCQKEYTPLIAAAEEGYLSIAKVLLEKGADPDLGLDNEGSPLIFAAREGHLEMVKLLQSYKADIDLPVIGDGNALTAASQSGYLSIVEFLLQSGADVNKAIPFDDTPLINAASGGHLHIVKLLVANGADVNQTVKVHADEIKLISKRKDISPNLVPKTRSALSIAEENGFKEIVSYLKENGAFQ